MSSPGIGEALGINQLITSFPSLAYLLGWMVPLLQFNKDYWYYLYHDRNLTGHYLTEIFFQIITQLNNQQSLPMIGEYMDNIDQQVTDSVNRTFNVSKNYTSNLVFTIDKSPSYFLLNVYSVFLWNLPQVIIIVLLAKFLKVLFKKMYRICVSTSVVPIVGNIYMEVN